MITVIGATGNVGRHLVAALAAAGEEVTAVSRRPGEFPAGVRHVGADITDPASLKPAVDGARALFVLVDGAGFVHTKAADVVEVAKAGGVARVVALSSQGVGTRPDSSSHGTQARAYEAGFQDPDLEWTILRPNGFQSNTLAWAESVRTRREVAAPFADVALPFVDPADIAEVAAAALTRDGHHGATYVLTGPVADTPRERTAALAEVLGEPVRFVEQSRAQARAEMLAYMPEPVVETTLDVLGRPTAAEAEPTPVVERLLGRPGNPFRGWGARNAALFR
ncbi:MAG: NAD(P)H-binding protein [Mycobacteriaceae bacterium]|nr:NAD(P)H-binding protein [Mycobacteriaceae bacterium]